MNDGSSDQPKMTAGLDLGDRYSYLCLIDTVSGEVLEEGRLRTTPEALRRRFCSERPLRVAIEAGTHSPWVSRLLEEECGHAYATLIVLFPTPLVTDYGTMVPMVIGFGAVALVVIALTRGRLGYQHYRQEEVEPDSAAVPT